MYVDLELKQYAIERWPDAFNEQCREADRLAQKTGNIYVVCLCDDGPFVFDESSAVASSLAILYIAHLLI